MNNIMKKLALGLAVMGTVGATAFAAPSKGHDGGKPAKPPAAQQVVKHNGANKTNKSKKVVINNYNMSGANHGSNHNAAKTKPPQNSGHSMANNRRPHGNEYGQRPSAHHEEVRRDDRHRHHESHYSSSTLHTEDWVGIGAILVGGLIGGLIGGAL